jgi:hypothetical protein
MQLLKQHHLIVMLFVVFSVLISLPVSANEVSPATQNNACHPDGLLANQCDTQQDWLCGWHIARWDAAGGYTGGYALPADCSAYLPAISYPIGDWRENACNINGELEGKCDTEWAWTCGWYLAQWINAGGWAGTYVMPDTCASLLPAVSDSPTPPSSPYPSAGCVPFSGSYVNFQGGWYLPMNSPQYNLPDCTDIPLFTTVNNLVFVPASYDANDLCQAAFGRNVVGMYPNDIYSCFD